MSGIGWLRLAALLLVLTCALAGALLQDEVRIVDLRDGFAAAGAWAPLLFIAAYVLATILSLPGPLLTITGGMLFGAAWATGYSLLGAIVGGVLAFLIARYLARDWFEQRIGPRLGPIKRGVDDEGWRFVLVIRLLPVLPYAVLNYGFGLTRIRLTPYTLASIVGMLPATFVYSYIGDVGLRVLEGERGSLYAILFAIGAFVALIFLPGFIRRLRRRHHGPERRSH